MGVRGVEFDEPGKGDPERDLNRVGGLEVPNKVFDHHCMVHPDLENCRQRAAQSHGGEYQMDPLLPATQKDPQMQNGDGSVYTANGDTTDREIIRHARSGSPRADSRLENNGIVLELKQEDF